MKRSRYSTLLWTCLPVKTGLHWQHVCFAEERQDCAISRTNYNLDGASRFWRRPAMMPHERRLNIRKPLEHIAYLSLPPNNGGMVLDVSEGGLAFRAIAPVEADGPIHFRFAIDSATRIKAVGELAWKDETGKSGGLRFTELPDEAREQIRLWAGQSQTRAQTRAQAMVQAMVQTRAQTFAQTKAQVSAQPSVIDIPVAEPAIAAEVAPSSEADLAPVAAASNPPPYNWKPSIYSGLSNSLSMFPLEQNSEAGTTSFAVPQSACMAHPIAAVGLTIALAFLVSIGIFTYVSTSRAGELFFDWGEKVLGRFYSQPITSDPPPPARFAPDSSKTPQQ